MPLDEKTLNIIKNKLLEEKERLEKQLLEFATKKNHGQEDYSANFPDYGWKEDENAAEVASFSENLSLERTLENLLRDVKKSLKRIEEKTYGICIYCKREIDIKRLLARPTSSSCIECKKKLLKEK